MNTYRNNIPKNSITVMEASANSFAFADMLRDEGYGIKVVLSNTVSRFERPDHINDAIDAYNLAYAESVGLAKEVYLPTKVELEWRNMIRDYKSADAELTYQINKIWGFCHSNKLPLPPKRHKSRITFLEDMISASPEGSTRWKRLSRMLDQYKDAYEYKRSLRKEICLVVARNQSMTHAMTLLGIGAIMAFTLVAYIGDIKRFKTSSKLVSYFGFNPICNESGKSKSVKRLSPYGNSFIKAMLVESLKTAMRKGKTAACVWAKRKMAAGKPRNVVLCALARKILCYLFHVLNNHPTPNRETEKSYYPKLIKLAGSIGKENVTKLGYCRAHDFALWVVDSFYAHLPPGKPEDSAPREPPKIKRTPRKPQTAA